MALRGTRWRHLAPPGATVRGTLRDGLRRPDRNRRPEEPDLLPPTGYELLMVPAAAADPIRLHIMEKPAVRRLTALPFLRDTAGLRAGAAGAGRARTLR